MPKINGFQFDRVAYCVMISHRWDRDWQLILVEFSLVDAKREAKSIYSGVPTGQHGSPFLRIEMWNGVNNDVVWRNYV